MDEAARRELYEETGAEEYEGLERIAQYSVDHGDRISWGSVYKVEITRFGKIPEDFEIEELDLVDDFPFEASRFPDIMPGLMEWLDLRLLPRRKWRGTRLDIAMLKNEDLPAVAGMLEKETVRRWIFSGPSSPGEAEVFYASSARDISDAFAAGRPPEVPAFALWDRRDGEFAGVAVLLPDDGSAGARIIEYQLDDSVWGRGFGKEAARFLSHYAFSFLKARRVGGSCVSGDDRFRDAMLGLGFTEEGCQADYWHRNGRFYDNLLFGLVYQSLDQAGLEALGRHFEPADRDE